MCFYCCSCYNWCQCGGINLAISVIIVVTWVFTTLAVITGVSTVGLALFLLITSGVWVFTALDIITAIGVVGLVLLYML